MWVYTLQHILGIGTWAGLTVVLLAFRDRATAKCADTPVQTGSGSLAAEFDRALFAGLPKTGVQGATIFINDWQTTSLKPPRG